MLGLLEQAASAGARLVVFPELAFTTFFPRWLMDDAEIDALCSLEPHLRYVDDTFRRLGLL